MQSNKNHIDMKQWYLSLFENYGLKYDNEILTQGMLCDKQYSAGIIYGFLPSLKYQKEKSPRLNSSRDFLFECFNLLLTGHQFCF